MSELLVCLCIVSVVLFFVYLMGNDQKKVDGKSDITEDDIEKIVKKILKSSEKTTETKDEEK